MISEFQFLSGRNKADLRIAMYFAATNLTRDNIRRILDTEDINDVMEAEKYIKQCFVEIKHPESGNYGT